MEQKKRDKLSLKMKEVLARLKKKGVRAEHVAVRLNYSHAAVEKWVSGERIPKIPVIQRIETEFGVKIL